MPNLLRQARQAGSVLKFLKIMQGLDVTRVPLTTERAGLTSPNWNNFRNATFN